MCDLVVSSDVGGMVEFWTGPKGDYNFTKSLEWEYKTDTDWYEFVKVSEYVFYKCLDVSTISVIFTHDTVFCSGGLAHFEKKKNSEL